MGIICIGLLLLIAIGVIIGILGVEAEARAKAGTRGGWLDQADPKSGTKTP